MTFQMTFVVVDLIVETGVTTNNTSGVEAAVIVVYLPLQAIFFTIQLLLFGSSYVPPVMAGVKLFLPSDRLVLIFEPTILAVQMTFVIIYFIIEAVVPAKHFGSARMLFGKRIATAVTINLALHTIFFAIELALLAARNVPAIDSSITLFLPANVVFFAADLTEMPFQMTSVVICLPLKIVVSVQYLCSSRMLLGKLSGPAWCCRC
jgi:hypothetical protein